jgi:dienelactone hydrolase
MENEIGCLMSKQSIGKVSRRQFLKQAMLLLGGGAGANAGLFTLKELSPGQLTTRTSATPLPPSSGAIRSASPIETSMIEFMAKGDMVPAYLARPVGNGPFPGLVITPDWYGLDDSIKATAERAAAEGFAVLAPDFYRGSTAANHDDVRRLLGATRAERAIDDLQGAVNHLIRQGFAKPGKVGIMAFSFGDRLAVSMSQTGKHVGAVVVVYGGNIDPRSADLMNLTAPDIHGEQHLLRTYHLLDFPKPARASDQRSVPTLILHAFFNRTAPYDRGTGAAAAWQQAIRWLNQNLTPEGSSRSSSTRSA